MKNVYGNCFRAGIALAASALALPGYAQDNAALMAQAAPPDALWLDSLDLSNVWQDYGAAHAGKSVDGNPIKLGGISYAHGVGTHAGSQIVIDLHGEGVQFEAMVGVDDETAKEGSAQFRVLADGKLVAQTEVMRGGGAPIHLTCALTGAQKLTLIVGDGGDGITFDHADWAGALLTLKPGAAHKPVLLADTVGNDAPPPISMEESPLPAIHGPRIVGATPGNPFLFRIPATGDGPLTFDAKNLPAGLTLDSATGIISGSLKAAGTTKVRLTVHGAKGKSSRSLTIVGGDHPLGLTPPMGWNSWNVWATSVDADKVKAAADEMVSSGLAAHGFQYINIDDSWEAGRDAAGNILSNEKFPDMKGMADYVHAKGLKLGVYSSPGPQTCGHYTGSYQHEQQDANTYAAWGVDYLKYDWCSYGDIATGDGQEKYIAPYRIMGDALYKTNRDIFYSLCQYGMGDVWTWGASVHANSWRTTGDINDTWRIMYGTFSGESGHEKYAGPGHWNDTDMLVVGRLGWSAQTHPTKLKPNEQILHITVWSLLSSPLLIGCDLTQLDPFTKALLTNDEVLDVNQDPLGKPAGRIANNNGAQIWARPLWDGTQAVGLVNTGSLAADITVTWAQLGLTGKQPIRDLWRRKDIGALTHGYTVSVPAHSAVLIKVGKPKKMD
ncbi:alpha-galactosidase [Capsulimonas corticalis]|uniref:Alpha-galactosidase n=1 Tax=Capsulimonas corticalis TaxID=2219043 RepID=A0A402CVI3_9BACT|nr:NPCBM/NEW2 domain-containing protein [Capsulimonas corticalis]BDI30415.1 alpha-galactosidase [Capsulimonas corticalis]